MAKVSFLELVLAETNRDCGETVITGLADVRVSC